MCCIVVINRGEKEIQTPGEFKAHFGFLPDENVKREDMDYCLCHCDIDKAFNDHNIEYKKIFGSEYYVGQLDLVHE